MGRKKEILKKAAVRTLTKSGFVKNIIHPCPKEFTGYNKTRQKLNTSSLCYAPNVNLYFGFGGKVTVCCYNRNHILGTYPENSVSEIWNGAQNKIIREKLEQYDLHSGCSPCENLIKENAYYSVLARTFDELKPDPAYPVSMEFELDNICNLECEMCSGEFSSKILTKLENGTQRKCPYNSEFVSQLKPFIPHLKKAKFQGGEPFLIEIYYEIWEQIIALNHACDIIIQTNGTVLNSRIRNLMEQGRFSLIVSIDSLKKDVFETIRKNADFEKVLENLKYFIQYTNQKKSYIGISVCPMRKNQEEIPEIINFCNKHNIAVTFNKVWHPADCSLWNLSSSELKDIESNYLKASLPSKSHTEYHNLSQFKNLIQQINSWHSQSVMRENKLSGLMKCDVKELESRIFDNMISFDTIATEKENSIEIMKNMLSEFQSDAQYKQLLIKILELPVEILCRELSLNSKEKLTEQIHQLLKNKK